LGSSKEKSGIKAPKLPKELPPAELPGDMPAYGETYSQLEYQRLDLADSAIERLHFETVIFTQAILAAARFEHLRLEDVRLAGCNFTLSKWANQ
jgi:uncharacterized protein YjbI with pentapeptide repeats